MPSPPPLERVREAAGVLLWQRRTACWSAVTASALHVCRCAWQLMPLAVRAGTRW
ncbi:hypothetical protein [Streptomyces werraensis]|uniref:hypothetical protein n=1 Tax=Streptomyces werraensis TaxID=68284 RepID=UPI00342D25E5